VFYLYPLFIRPHRNIENYCPELSHPLILDCLYFKSTTMHAIKVIKTGLGIGESPRWHDGRLWFSNWVAQEVIALSPDGKSEVITKMSSFPFSIDWLPDGRLLVISGHDQLLLRREPNGEWVTHADLRGIADHGFNELVVDSRGNAYVNGGLAFGGDTSAGIIILVSSDGKARKVAEGIAFPNGMAITPDNSTLIIAESHGRKLTAFDIAGDGSLSNRRVWADLITGVPDGICIDEQGAVWYADVPNKSVVRVLEGGEELDRVVLDRGCFACMLGGEARSTLFVMAAEWRGFDKMNDAARTGQVLAIDVPVKGAGRP
jgi:sugar lactone lactonase YvrE